MPLAAPADGTPLADSAQPFTAPFLSLGDGSRGNSEEVDEKISDAVGRVLTALGGAEPDELAILDSFSALGLKPPEEGIPRTSSRS